METYCVLLTHLSTIQEILIEELKKLCTYTGRQGKGTEEITPRSINNSFILSSSKSMYG